MSCVVRALCFVLVRARVCGPRACVCQVCCSVSENGERAVRASACNETVVSALESETRSEREGDASARYVRGGAPQWCGRGEVSAVSRVRSSDVSR